MNAPSRVIFGDRRVLIPSLVVGGVVLLAGLTTGSSATYDVHAPMATTSTSSLPATEGASSIVASSSQEAVEPLLPRVTHIATPSPLKAVYMTSCIASGKRLRASLVELVDRTELNAIVIDIKDYSGYVAIDTGDPRFPLNVKGCTMPDIKEFIAELHERDIYVIGRVTVMQDSVYTKSHPDAAVKRKSDGGTWHDRKGLAFVDPGATEYWKHMVDLGELSHEMGFDEINYDYIRYPSDGNMSDALYSRTGSTSKVVMMDRFFAYLGKEMREREIPISADLFGMTTTNTDDLGIGQSLESALRHFDYVAPMVYPSHYPPNYNGWPNPNYVPGPIVKFAMSRAVERANTLEREESGYDSAVVATTTASTTPARAPFVPTGKYANKLRPWLQDFDYGKDYTAEDVRAQIKATYDSGLDSWMMWDPRNVYTPSAYLAE